MNKYPSCRHCNQIIYPKDEKNGFCCYCGMEINELSNTIKELEKSYE